jgi:hypothetical protein
MATELEQFVEANKQRLGEVNASNPQLYSAISMALDYLNKNYFGGTTELKVNIPQPTPVTPAETTQTDSVERLFTPEELGNLILDNVWTLFDFKEIKIELKTPIQKQNFLNFIKLLVGGRDTYVTRGNIGNYFYTDEDLVVFNYEIEDVFRQSPYQLLYYNQIFENLLKAQQRGKLPSVWDSVYAYSSKDYATPIDYNFLQKAIYSKRRSKDMKLEIARAFGEIKSISRATASNWDEVEKNYGKTTADLIYQYELNDEVFKIVEDKGFDFFNVTQYSDLDVKEWISELIFYEFEEPLKFDDIKEKLLEWYRNQINKPTTQTHTPTPQTSTIPNAKFKIGDKVKIISVGQSYPNFQEMFKTMGFANKVQNDEARNGDVGTIFAVENLANSDIVYGVLVEVGATRKYQTLISEEGIELFQPTPLSASKYEVGDWVRLKNNDSLVGVEKGTIGLVTQFDSSDDPYIEWQDKKTLSENGLYLSTRFELALKNPKPIFKIGDLVRWKEDVLNYNVKQGAIAEVVGFGVFDGNILANVKWVDTKDNMLKVNNQSDGGYNEDFFELALSNEKMEEIAENVASKITSKTIQPEKTTITTTSEDKDEEDFEDLADELENLDF